MTDSQTPSAGARTPIEEDSATLWVSGLSCPLCATNVDKQLVKVPGVRKVDVFLNDGRVVVGFAKEPHPTREELTKAIKESGFTLNRIEVP